MTNPLSESIEQQKFIQYLKAKKILHNASMNENQQSFSNRAAAIRIETKARSMGKSKGFPDVAIYEPNKYYHGLFIELKRAPRKLKNGKISVSHTKVSKEQEEWINKLREKGYEAKVCYGCKDAIELVESYMEQ